MLGQSDGNVTMWLYLESQSWERNEVHLGWRHCSRDLSFGVWTVLSEGLMKKRRCDYFNTQNQLVQLESSFGVSLGHHCCLQFAGRILPFLSAYFWHNTLSATDRVTMLNCCSSCFARCTSFSNCDLKGHLLWRFPVCSSPMRTRCLQSVTREMSCIQLHILRLGWTSHCTNTFFLDFLHAWSLMLGGLGTPSNFPR